MGEGLRERAWRLVEPYYLLQLSGLVDQFAAARANGLGTDQLGEIALAVVARRVAMLLIEAERHVPGSMDHATGRIRSADLAHPEIDDLLDDFGEFVLKTGGEVVVVPHRADAFADGHRRDLQILKLPRSTATDKRRSRRAAAPVLSLPQYAFD
jgi:hypothetical protein